MCRKPSLDDLKVSEENNWMALYRRADTVDPLRLAANPKANEADKGGGNGNNSTKAQIELRRREISNAKLAIWISGFALLASFLALFIK